MADDRRGQALLASLAAPWQTALQEGCGRRLPFLRPDEPVQTDETANGFESARDGYQQLPVRDSEEYEEQDRSPLTRPGLAPEPDAGRSIFDDVDVG
jgi:hypothetical protein